MAYCSQSDVQMAAGGSARLQQLSDWEDEGAINAAVVADCIEAAEARINEYLQKRHAVTLAAPIPPGIVKIAAAEAVFEMKDRRDMVTEKDLALHTERQQRLDDIAKGVRTVGVTPLPTASEIVVDAQTARPSDKQVSRDETKGFW